MSKTINEIVQFAIDTELDSQLNNLFIFTNNRYPTEEEQNLLQMTYNELIDNQDGL